MTDDLRRENLWLRDTLTLVAQDLEHFVADPALHDAARRARATRVQRIRARWHDGPLPGWSPTRLGDSTCST